MEINNQSPTATEMKKFSERFSKKEWSRICGSKEFLDLFCDDAGFKKCRPLAEKILAGWKPDIITE